MRRVFGPREPGLYQGKTGLHEYDQHRTDHYPQQVYLLAYGGNGIALLRQRRGRRAENEQAGEAGDDRQLLGPNLRSH